MKPGESLKKNNFDIFSQEITPIDNYSIKGDENPEHEIKIIYLKKIISKFEQYQKSKLLLYNSVNPSLYNNPSLIEKKTNYNEKKSKIGSSDLVNNNEDIIYNHNINNSLDQNKSSEFLLTLFNQGVCPYEKNKNVIELTERQKEKFKLKNNNPFLFSFHTLHPFSVFYGTKYDKLIKKNNELRLPAPNFITKEEWCKPVDNSFKSIFKGIEIDDKSGLVISDPIVRKKFSGLIKDIIIQIIQVPFGHHISLNVKIFEPKTILERYTSAFSYANIFLLPACNPKLSPYERFKLVISFQFAGLYIACQQLKPFNPFLGETYQGELPNGAKLYVENISHKPLIARFLLIYKKKYEISGYWDLSVKTQSFGSEMLINQKGPIYVKFPELNECIVCHLPCIKAINATSETNRALLYFGNMVYVDVKNKLKAVIQFNYNKNKFHEIKGCTMNYFFPEDYKYIFDKEWEYGMNCIIEEDNMEMEIKSINSNNEEFEIIDKIKGSYLEMLIIGNEIAWDINQIPEYIKPVKYCIPSDGRYREDLIWLFRSFYGAKDQEEEEIYRKISMEWKVMMEDFYRWEKKKRSTYEEKMEK